MKTVAAYCRVSTDSADQANSFASQQVFFREYIERHPDWSLAEIYADEGISGTSTRKRTQFNRMLADAERGRFSLILTKEISRFSRNILDTIRCTRRLKELGVGVLFLTENLSTLNPEAELLLTFMGVLAQEESRRTSVRVKWGQMRRMEQGVVFGRSLLGYRVEGGTLTIDPKQAETVRLIFQKYVLEGKGPAAIARELAGSGHRTAAGSIEWNPGHIVKILKNEKYAGDLIQKKSITPDYLTHAKKINRGQEPMVILRDHHVPIVPRVLWDAAQTRLKTRSPGQIGRSSRHGFSGKIRCGECGAAFVSRKKQQSSGSYRRWVCGTAAGKDRGVCDVGRLLRDDDAHEMVQTALSSLELDREGLIETILKTIPAGQHDLHRQRDRLLQKQEKCLDAYCAGELSTEELCTLRVRFDRELSELDSRIRAAEEELSAGDIRNALDGSEALHRAVLESITVFRDRHMELRLTGLPRTFIFR